MLKAQHWITSRSFLELTPVWTLAKVVDGVVHSIMAMWTSVITHDYYVFSAGATELSWVCVCTLDFV